MICDYLIFLGSFETPALPFSSFPWVTDLAHDMNQWITLRAIDSTWRCEYYIFK